MNSASNLLLPKESHLFLSRAWQLAWRNTWGQKVEDENLTNSGSIWLYSDKLLIKKLLPISSMSPVGYQSQSLQSVRAEYFQIESQADLDDCFSSDPHQVVFPDVIRDSKTANLIEETADKNNLLLVRRNPSSAYSIRCEGNTFQQYLNGLSSSTRSKLFNRRKRLLKRGILKIEDFSDSPERFLALLNQFHIERWGKACFEGLDLKFLLQMFMLLPNEGGKAELSVMKLDGVPISVLLDIRIGDRIYNLQSGFKEGVDSGLSLGTLHLGYSIEAAFLDADIAYYDFLAGEGKNSNYKKNIATEEMHLEELVLVKGLWLKWLYHLNAKFINLKRN